MRNAVNSLDAEPIDVRPATLERFDDIEPVINRSCWCPWWRQIAAEYGRSKSDTHRAACVVTLARPELLEKRPNWGDPGRGPDRVAERR